MGFREEECWDDPAGAEGFSSRANIVEAGHASFLRSLGGRKMQLDITAAVLVTGAGMLLQMSDAKARREALTKPAGGPTMSDNRRRQEEWQRRVEDTREELRGGGGLREGEREFLRRVEEGGYLTDPVGTDRIESRTKRRRDTMESWRKETAEGGGDDEEGTHRADTTRREVKKKRGRWSVLEGETEEGGGSGLHKDVRKAMGGFTEVDLLQQAREYERWEEEKHAKSRGGGIWKDDVPVEDWDELDRMQEDENRGKSRSGGNWDEDEVPVEERDELDRLREELDEGEAEMKRRRQREGEEESENTEDAGEGEGEGGVGRHEEAEGRSPLEEHRQKRVPDEYRSDARKHTTPWGLARLKGNDYAICCGCRITTYGCWSCIATLNAGVKAGHMGNVVLMK